MALYLHKVFFQSRWPQHLSFYLCLIVKIHIYYLRMNGYLGVFTKGAEYTWEVEYNLGY